MRRALAVLLVASAGCTPASSVAPPAPPAPPAAPQAKATTTPPAPEPVASAEPSASAPAPAPEPPPEADSLPPGFVRIDEDTPCGAFRVEVQAESPKAFRRYVRVVGADGKRVYEAHGRSYRDFAADLSVDFCGDLTGDGVPEIVMTESTMGAHCCYTRFVVSLTTPPRRIMMWDKGDAGTEILPVKYEPGAAWQLEDLLVMWPPFDTEKGDPVLSYASAPLVPVVFSLVGGEYKLTSLAYPAAYKKQREEIRAMCAKDPNGCFGDVILWIDALAIGDWDVEKKSMQDAELRTALDRRAPAMRKMLAGLGSRARPVKP